ncbi:MAG: WXG100 family type VII secretion target [Actinomycetales bacterium]
MSRFQVDAAQVASASAAVLTSVSNIGAEVDLLSSRLNDLQSTWQGQAASRFQTVAHDWRLTQEQVKAALEQISQALGAAATTYAEAEAANLRMFAG